MEGENNEVVEKTIAATEEAEAVSVPLESSQPQN